MSWAPRHVVLEERHVALGLQRDVAKAARPILAQKMAKSARHVVLGVSHVALGFQRDMAKAVRPLLTQKMAKKRPPRRVGREPRRIGAPIRHGCGRKLPFSLKNGERAPATSCWA